jgi:uncharacterized protein
VTRERVLAIMAKAPRPGHAKTRLAHSADRAIDLYRCLVEDTVALARQLHDVDIAVVCPIGDRADLAAWLEDVNVVEQAGTGLAAALTGTFEHFAAAGYRRIVAFNADTPHLPPAILERAFEALAAHDLVVGPTTDGGYYLVGARSAAPSLFDASPIGTGSALGALLARADALGLVVARTDAWYDIDVGRDLERLAAELAVHPEAAPRTAAHLAKQRRSP